MLMRPQQTFWRKEHARRAAVLIDAARYFGAARAAMRKAKSHIFIVGWDIHSRTAFVGESGAADDGYPEAFGDFLSALVRERPSSKSMCCSGILPCSMPPSASCSRLTRCAGIRRPASISISTMRCRSARRSIRS